MRNVNASTLSRLCLLFAIALSVPAITVGQVVYDWSSNSKTPESYAKVVRKENVTFTITNVNDILYSYRLEVTETPIESDDFKHLTEIFKGFAARSTEIAKLTKDCSAEKARVLTAFAEVSKAINDDPKLPVGYGTLESRTSISLAESVQAWRSHGTALEDAVQLLSKLPKDCVLDDDDQKQIDDFRKTVEAIDEAVKGPHVFVDHHVLSPGNNVSVTIFELFDRETISSKNFTFPGTDILTLSAGALFSRIPDRGYDARKTPNATENVLAVEGNSRATPSLLALLNYSLGALKLDGENAGLAISAGPVIRLGGESNASAFGFFSGISAHLARRLYITPGLHFGQFSDFPVGFGNGSTVPANFGQLTPVKRWTARFGLGITFKAKDFSGLVSSEAPSVTGDEAGGTAKPKDPAEGDSEKIKRALDNLEKNLTRKRSTAGSPSGHDRSPAVEDTPNPFDEPENRETRGGLVHVARLRSSMSAADDRISIIASSSIRDYASYFKGNRFFFKIPRAELDVMSNDLQGRLFNEPLVEKRGDDLVLSLELSPGVRVSISQRTDGLDLILLPANSP
jgi:hypothetical protein